MVFKCVLLVKATANYNPLNIYMYISYNFHITKMCTPCLQTFRSIKNQTYLHRAKSPF